MGSCARQPAAGNRQPATGNRRPATGNRRPATGNRRPAADALDYALPVPILAAVMPAPHAPIELREFPEPVIEPGGMLLRTMFSEVCIPARCCGAPEMPQAM